jgi:hypothetical protein
MNTGALLPLLNSDGSPVHPTQLFYQAVNYFDSPTAVSLQWIMYTNKAIQAYGRPIDQENQAWLRELILSSSSTELNSMLRTALDTHELCDHTGLLTLYYLDRNCIDLSTESLWAIFTNLGKLRLTQFPGQAIPTASHNIRVLTRWLHRCNFQQFDPRIPVDNCMTDTTVEAFSYFYQSMKNQEDLQQHRYTADTVLNKCEDFYHKALIKGTWLVTSPSSTGFSSVQAASAQVAPVLSADTRRFAQVFAPPSGNQRHSKTINGNEHHFCSSCGWNRRHLEADCPFTPAISQAATVPAAAAADASGALVPTRETQMIPSSGHPFTRTRSPRGGGGNNRGDHGRSFGRGNPGRGRGRGRGRNSQARGQQRSANSTPTAGIRFSGFY